METLRESAAGQLIRALGGSKLLPYADERPGWQAPECYHRDAVPKPPAETRRSSETAVDQAETNAVDGQKAEKPKDVEKQQQQPLQQSKSHQQELPVIRAGVSCGPEGQFILVDWYGEDDPDNPQNWSTMKKSFFICLLGWLTFVVYMAASVISPGFELLIADYGISELVAGLTIGLYVLGYGLGPLLFSPLSEIPAIGRSPMYIAPFFLFFAVNFATIFTPTFGGLLVARFISGFVASPPLATGGASVQDVLSPLMVPNGFILWVVSAYQGPGLGPVITAWAIQHYGTWRWAFAVHQFFVVVTLVIVFFLFPETSGPNILARRAKRLRLHTGNDRLRSQGEINQAEMNAKDVYYDAIVKPFEITIKDPAIAFANIYISLLYAFYYLFFAAFPIVFFQEYGLSFTNGNLPYLSFTVGGSIFAAMYALLYNKVVVPAILSGNAGEPEDALLPALPASILSAASLWAFAWSAGRTSLWAPIIFTAVFAGANFIVLQPIFAYIGMAYPRYAASIFASNDAMRSSLAFGFLIAGTPMFDNLGVGGGGSITAGLVTACVPGIFALKWYGKKLRSRSSFAVVDKD